MSKKEGIYEVYWLGRLHEDHMDKFPVTDEKQIP